MTTTEPEKALTRNEAAELVGVTVECIGRAMRAKRLRAFKTGRGKSARWLTFRSWVNTWIEAEADAVVPSSSAPRELATA